MTRQRAGGGDPRSRGECRWLRKIPAGRTFGEDAWEEEPSVSDAGENSEEAAEDLYKDEFSAVDAMFGGADEAAADGAAPAEPASPAAAEDEL